MTSQVALEGRARHHHESGDYLVDERTGKCWFCGQKPAGGVEVDTEISMQIDGGERTEYMPISKLREINQRLAAVKSNPEVELETGEMQGQLILGFSVPRVAVQRRADVEMSADMFNRTIWDFADGDKLTATMRDGMLRVRIVKGWEVE